LEVHNQRNQLNKPSQQNQLNEPSQPINQSTNQLNQQIS